MGHPGLVDIEADGSGSNLLQSDWDSKNQHQDPRGKKRKFSYVDGNLKNPNGTNGKSGSARDSDRFRLAYEMGYLGTSSSKNRWCPQFKLAHAREILEALKVDKPKLEVAEYLQEEARYIWPVLRSLKESLSAASAPAADVSLLKPITFADAGIFVKGMKQLFASHLPGPVTPVSDNGVDGFGSCWVDDDDGPIKLELLRDSRGNECIFAAHLYYGEAQGVRFWTRLSPAGSAVSGQNENPTSKFLPIQLKNHLLVCAAAIMLVQNLVPPVWGSVGNTPSGYIPPVTIQLQKVKDAVELWKHRPGSADFPWVDVIGGVACHFLVGFVLPIDMTDVEYVAHAPSTMVGRHGRMVTLHGASPHAVQNLLSARDYPGCLRVLDKALDGATEPNDIRSRVAGRWAGPNLQASIVNRII